MPEENDYTMYSGRIGYQDFQRAVEEQVEEMSFREGDSEPRRINPTPVLHAFLNPESMMDCTTMVRGTIAYIAANSTTYVYDGQNWIAQVNETATFDGVTQYINTGYPPNQEAWYDVNEERELRNFMSQQRTAARLSIEQNLEGGGILEQMQPLSDQIQDAQLALQTALDNESPRFSERMDFVDMKEEPSDDFLANIE